MKLHEGSQVLLTSSSEMGTIRYIGPTNFAPGIWLGLELRSAKGKNDGSVGEKRYFTCKPKYGVLVRPSRVTYRGINGVKLVDDICWRTSFQLRWGSHKNRWGKPDFYLHGTPSLPNILKLHGSKMFTVWKCAVTEEWDLSSFHCKTFLAWILLVLETSWIWAALLLQ